MSRRWGRGDEILTASSRPLLLRISRRWSPLERRASGGENEKEKKGWRVERRGDFMAREEKQLLQMLWTPTRSKRFPADNAENPSKDQSGFMFKLNCCFVSQHRNHIKILSLFCSKCSLDPQRFFPEATQRFWNNQNSTIRPGLYLTVVLHSRIPPLPPSIPRSPNNRGW